ncbi:CynX/NimT family MFS transporter [Bartonella sp. HY761]|uniref:CynX/NimT family MFS transporter n=1 Tax=Bartonella sp. HY761 TaxID=2979330 RepID=UPI00220784F3|nr:MFS transporter [Bartonella sp. HY761]UXN05632.1 MFS transporter [Bartonella sp. HY761]
MSGYSNAQRSKAWSIYLGVSLILVALNLRPVFSSLSILLSPDISNSTGISGFQAGLLTTLPVVCLGIFAPLAPWGASKIGAERTMFLALIVLAIGTALRGFGPLSTLYLGSILAGAAIALGNVLMPSLVKRDFPHHIPLMTGLFSMALCGGAAIAVGFTVPLKHILNGSWQLTLAAWAIPVLLAIILWLPQLKSHSGQGAQGRYQVKGLLRQPIAWQVTLFMGLQSALAYSVFGWLAQIIVERGIKPEQAGIITSVSILIQVVASLIMPLIAGRRSSQSGICVFLTSIAGIGLVGFILAPISTIWIWVVLQGLGQGGLIAVAMVIIALRSHDAPVASHLSGMAQGIGYCIAAIGPFLVGIIHEASGGFDATAGLFVALCLGAAFTGYLAGRPKTIPIKAERID